ncbi:MAG: hypothetical protein ACI8SR_003323 [Oceanicoccus sp.]|jgi:hypothetical protein
MSEEKNIVYYEYGSFSKAVPSGLFRFIENSEDFPERFTAKEGWVTDRNVMLKKMKGDIDDSDIISEQRAKELMQEIKNRNNN